MIFDLTNNEIDFIKSGDNLIKLLSGKGGEFEKVKPGKWITKDRKVILKASEFYRYFDMVDSKTSIKPWFAIVDEKIKRVVIIHIRTQKEKGSTYQKLPYGGFINRDYQNVYKEELKKYDVSIAFIMNSYWSENEKVYGNLIRYLKDELKILVWENEIRI